LKRELIYTETNVAGVYILIKVDTFKKVYKIENNLSQEQIDKVLADFIAPDLFEALLIGLKAKGYIGD
jgi:hypothetical protein